MPVTILLVSEESYMEKSLHPSKHCILEIVRSWMHFLQHLDTSLSLKSIHSGTKALKWDVRSVSSTDLILHNYLQSCFCPCAVVALYSLHLEINYFCFIKQSSRGIDSGMLLPPCWDSTCIFLSLGELRRGRCGFSLSDIVTKRLKRILNCSEANNIFPLT